MVEGGGGSDGTRNLGGRDNFCLINTYKAGSGLLVTTFQNWLFLAEPLAQHILIIILLLLTHR